MLLYTITKHYGLAHNARKSNTRSSSPVYLTRAPRSPTTSIRGMLTLIRVILATSQALLTQGRNPDVFRAGWWTPDPGLPYLHSPVSLAWLTPCRTRPCHLAFSRDFDTSHSRVVLPDTRIPWVASELMFLTRGIRLTRVFNIRKKVENLSIFFLFRK